VYPYAINIPSATTGVGDAINPVTADMDIFTGCAGTGALRRVAHGYAGVAITGAAAGIEDGIAFDEQVFLSRDKYAG